MSLGFPAFSVRRVALSVKGLELYAASESILSELKWIVTEKNKQFIIAKVPPSFVSPLGEIITIRFVSGKELEIKSRCVFAQFLDWGKNEQNIDAYLKKLYEMYL
ncbi:MAG: hypothetical protein EAZ57_07290 [Cytophagales bacterium]|nr:MAG: hypothetical protein EAZ67_08100 [Cytophagales bacterium]TAF60505.1 MAG: hypothetical protein EAZ57_07290 [Cytophagales bacterium]